MTLLETAVAVAVLAVGVVAVQRLAVQSLAGIADDAERTRAMLAAQRLLAESALAPPATGHVAGDVPVRGPDDAGLHYERDVLPTSLPGLREVRVRVFPTRFPEAACELVEVIRVPGA